MTSTMRALLMTAAAALPLGVGAAQAQQAAMTFFVTSAGPGKGADLGGLDGADRHCQNLAQAAGAGGKTWRAYLSTQGAGAVNAKDRIGRGPWQNAKGAVIAKDVADLHGASNNLTKQTALNEKGDPVNGRGDSRICTTSSPARSRTAPPSRSATTGPAATGPRAGRARPWSAITTAPGSTIPRRPSRGIRRIPRAGPVAAARRTISGAPAAPVCSIASPSTERPTSASPCSIDLKSETSDFGALASSFRVAGRRSLFSAALFVAALRAEAARGRKNRSKYFFP